MAPGSSHGRSSRARRPRSSSPRRPARRRSSCSGSPARSCRAASAAPRTGASSVSSRSSLRRGRVLELQFHPASGRGAVRTAALGDRGERLVLGVAALGAALAVSVWITVPAVCRRALRAENASALAQDSERTARARRDLEARVAGIRERALDGGDLVSRIAFLYGVPAAAWPRTLDPESGVLGAGDPAAVTQGLERYVGALDRAVGLVAAREAS